MPNLKEVKTRIKSVKNTQQITRAMQMVAAAKVRKVQDKVTTFRPYSEKIEDVFKNLSSKLEGEDIDEPLLKVRDVKNVGVVIITSDKGLCGSYNGNILRMMTSKLKDFKSNGQNPKLWLVGNKSFSTFKSEKYDLLEKYSQLPQIPTYNEARMLQNSIVSNFLDGTVDKVIIAYTKFVSMVKYEPTLLELIPVSREYQTKSESSTSAQYVFEPDAQSMISKIVPEYIENQIYRTLLESTTSELASRMTAMSSATDNAKEMLNSLTLVYNKARQAAITKEILEVVGGAEALNS